MFTASLVVIQRTKSCDINLFAVDISRRTDNIQSKTCLISLKIESTDKDSNRTFVT